MSSVTAVMQLEELSYNALLLAQLATVLCLVAAFATYVNVKGRRPDTVVVVAGQEKRPKPIGRKGGIDVYMMDSIVAKRLAWSGIGWEYQVRWAGYAEKDDTWEPAAMIFADAPQAVMAFEIKLLEDPTLLSASTSTIRTPVTMTCCAVNPASATPATTPVVDTRLSSMPYTRLRTKKGSRNHRCCLSTIGNLHFYIFLENKSNK